MDIKYCIAKHKIKKYNQKSKQFSKYIHRLNTIVKYLHKYPNLPAKMLVAPYNYATQDCPQLSHHFLHGYGMGKNELANIALRKNLSYYIFNDYTHRMFCKFTIYHNCLCCRGDWVDCYNNTTYHLVNTKGLKNALIHNIKIANELKTIVDSKISMIKNAINRKHCTHVIYPTQKDFEKEQKKSKRIQRQHTLIPFSTYLNSVQKR